MTVALIVLLSLASTALLLHGLNRPPRAEDEAEFAWADFAAELEVVGLLDPYVPLRPDALRIECRGPGAPAFDLVVTTLARDADGLAYLDGTGQAAAEVTHRFRLTGLSLGR